MTGDSDLWVTVFGRGSFGLGKGHKSWRGPKSYPITAEQAEAVLAWKADHPGADFVLVTAFEPDFDLEPDQLTGLFTLAELKLGTQRPPVEPDDPHEPPTDNDGEPLLAYPCDHCEASFPSAPILRRHVMLHHTHQAAEVEQAARERIAEDKAAKAAQARLEHADPTELHPAARDLADEPLEPARPSLWPPRPSEL